MTKKKQPIFTLAAVVMVMILAVPAVQAEVVVYDGFDSTEGTEIWGQGTGDGWDGTWTGTDTDSRGTPEVLGGLSFGTLPIAGGAYGRPARYGVAQSSRSISAASQATLTADNTTIWFSVLMDPTSAPAGGPGFAVNSHGAIVFGDTAFVDSTNPGTIPPTIGTGGSALGVSFDGIDSSFANVRIRSVTYSDGTRHWGSESVVVGDNTVMVVGRIDWAANGSNDVMTLYNVTDPMAALPEAFATMSADLDQSGFDLVAIGQGQTEVFDEIRFGETSADVMGQDPVDPDAPDVDAGVDMLTWSGEPVQLAPTVVNNDTDSPQAALTYAWSAVPADGVVFSATDVEAPTVTITKTTENPSVVTLTLAVNNVGRTEAPVEDTMTIDVYDNNCKAMIAAGVGQIDLTDFNGDCITDFEDLVIMVEAWLVHYELIEPSIK